MRFRIWALLAVLVLLLIPAGCATVRVSRGPVGTPVPIKTLRPTFTNTPATPTEIPPTATPVASPTSTPEPATPTPEEPTATATPETVGLTVTVATANVRSGPGTNYARIGQVRQGETYEVTGNNPAGDWWEFTFNGQPAWIFKDMVSVNGADRVQLASNIPAPPPTAKPRPTSPPAPPQPTSPPAQTYPFVASATAQYPNLNDYLTVRCRTVRDVASGKGAAGILKITGPMSPPPQSFGGALNIANTGMDKTMQYMYNESCKVEISPFVAGTYTAVLIDGGGNQISDPITFTPGGDVREWLLIWKPR